MTTLFISDLHLTAGDTETTRRFVELMDDRAEPATHVAHFRCATAQLRQHGPGAEGRAEKVRHGLGAVGERKGPHPRLVDQHLALIGIELWHFEPRPQEDPATVVSVTALEHGRSGIRGQSAGVEQVVGAANGALVRFRFQFAVSGGSTGDFGGCCFDLHVNFDHT